MNIHVINPYGTLPNEGWRKYRTNIAAEKLALKGHNVTLWISNIDHRSKKKRATTYTEYVINDNLKIVVVPSNNYTKNASFGRVRYESNFAKSVRRKFEENNFPSDCIIITDPCVFYGNIIYDVVKQTKSKFIIDILDIWPEVFVTLFPKQIRPLSNFLFRPLYKTRENLYRKSDGLIAVTNDYLQNALRNINDKPSKVVYIGIELDELPKNNNVTTFKGLQKNKNEKWIIYAGTLGINYDIKTIMEIGLKMERETNPFRLIIAGDGPMKEFVINFISQKGLTKTEYLGRLSVSELNQLYSLCDIALSTYLETSSVSFPVKAFDYLAFGLPVINSLGREFGELVKSKKIGLQYKAEDTVDMYSKVKQLLTNDNLLQQMKENSLKISKEFDIQNQYKRYTDFVERICINYE